MNQNHKMEFYTDQIKKIIRKKSKENEESGRIKINNIEAKWNGRKNECMMIWAN